MTAVEFNIDKPAPSEEAIHDNLNQARMGLSRYEKRYTLITSILLFGVSLILSVYQFFAENGNSFWYLESIHPFFMASIIIEGVVFFVALNAVVHNDNNNLYAGCRAQYLLLRLIRVSARISFVLSVMGASSFYLDLTPEDGLSSYVPIIVCFLFNSLFISGSYLTNHLKEINKYSPSSKERCFSIKKYKEHPEINAYRQSVVEQGRVFVNGDVDAMRDRYNELNDNLEAVCKEVYSMDIGK